MDIDKENCKPFWNMFHFYIFVPCRISCFFRGLGTLTVLGTNLISKQIPLSEQNIFSTDVCKLLNYHLQSSDLIKQFNITFICYTGYTVAKLGGGHSAPPPSSTLLIYHDCEL